ncbi:MAG: 1,4-alpha-glucan branching protein GlgB [Olsenella sp.]|jgi:1,4-alpha-glucan branching enzyme|nr:1,4-alpha-glucan branching protein GlgB [Olsenella sp.]MCI1289645.1 1,4-alpha-glucan branching protein GlgB [Olsenella sp.]
MSNPIANYLLTNDDLYLMGKGEWYRSYEKLGAHPCNKDGVEGYWFAVWAPDVKGVSVIGDFNDWELGATRLTSTPTNGVWYGFAPGATEGQLYKYVIETAQGDLLYKADPYAFYAECPPGTASRLTDLSGYEWQDEKYLASRSQQNFFKRPLNIFECHLGSWKRHPDGLAGNGDPDSEDHSGSYLTYDELSEELVDYVKQMGYSHIEVLPVMEHPFDGSWGYQVTGYYAPTSRYGNPHQFKHFVDACHQAGIGVILDWVPGGFCRDEHGLVHFNGNKLYEKEEHPNWGTFKFDFTKNEVRNFLTSNLLYWVGEYHADGIRMDGVTSMLYLNFGVDDPGQKKFNSRGTEEDDASIEFIRNCNDTVAKYYPDVMMIAEESTAWPLVTYPTSDGGLGFHFKWDMGWMNDTLHYMQTDFPYRPGNHKLLTFSTMYQFNENFILPLSHDEVVHGKCSLITRMPGDYWRQFAGMRALALYQMTHAGGKLNFMGNEIAQFIEWRYYEGIQYFLTDEYESHAHQQHFVSCLNRFYNEHPALWQDSYAPTGFDWIDADNADQCIISFARHGDDEKDDLVVLINFEVNPYEEFRIGVPRPGIYEEVFNSDDEEFGGSGVTNKGVKFVTVEEPWNRQEQSIELRVPPLAGLILRYVGPLPKRRTRKPRAKATDAKPAEKDEATTSAKAPASKAKAAASKTAAKPRTTTSRKATVKSETKKTASGNTASAKTGTTKGTGKA